jgi:penicillin-binding protein 2
LLEARRPWHGGPRTSLSESCDVYYYDMAERVGIEKITAMARRLGLGVRTTCRCRRCAGLTPTRPGSCATRGAGWVIGDTRQRLDRAGLRAGLAAAAGGDDRAAGHRARGLAAPDQVGRRRRAARGAGAPPGAQRATCADARGDVRGVERPARHRLSARRIIAGGMRMAGKTGTSQVRNITAAERARA